MVAERSFLKCCRKEKSIAMSKTADDNSWRGNVVKYETLGEQIFPFSSVFATITSEWTLFKLYKSTEANSSLCRHKLLPSTHQRALIIDGWSLQTGKALWDGVPAKISKPEHNGFPYKKRLH